MEKFVEIETHIHTVPVSPCSYLQPEDIVDFYKKHNYYGIILSNHFLPSIFPKQLRSWESKVDYFLKDYYTAKKLGEAKGLNVFLGMEINLSGTVCDFLIFGLTEEFLYAHENFYDLSLPQLFALFHGQDMLMFQAHPYRYGLEPCDPEYYHGIEVFNAHPRHPSRNQMAIKFAKENNLWLSSGSDAHSYEDMGRSGIMLPPVTNTQEVCQYYRKNGSPELIIVCEGV